jgi:hypothetical protein
MAGATNPMPDPQDVHDPSTGETRIDERSFSCGLGRYPRERRHGGPISFAGEQQTGWKVPQ